jgi:hypothetical protein
VTRVGLVWSFSLSLQVGRGFCHVGCAIRDLQGSVWSLSLSLQVEREFCHVGFAIRDHRGFSLVAIFMMVGWDCDTLVLSVAFFRPVSMIGT